MEKVGRLEGTVSAMEGDIAVIRNVNTLLSRQLNEAKQIHTLEDRLRLHIAMDIAYEI